VPIADFGGLTRLATDACRSPSTRYHYGLRISRFLQSGLALNHKGLALHVARLREAGTGIPEQRLTIAAIRKLASEAQVWGAHQPRHARQGVPPAL
jgi:hypothetical protein